LQRPTILGATIFLQILTTVSFAARVYTRLAIVKTFKVDDWVLVAAWVLSTAASVNVYIQLAYGLGRHSYALPFSSIGSLALSSRTLGLIFLAAPCLSKLAICLSYRHIFAVSPRTRIALTAIIVWLIVPNVVCLFLSVFYCKPLNQIWTADSMTVITARPKCLNFAPAYYFNGAATLLTDLALIALVVPAVIKLNMSGRKKALALSIASLGWLAVAATVIRLILASSAILKLGEPSHDPSWDTSRIVIWSAVEWNVSLFCATAMGVTPLITRLLPPAFFEQRGNASTPYKGGHLALATIGGSGPAAKARLQSRESDETKLDSKP